MYKKHFRAKTIKQKNIENISDYSKNKILYSFIKEHSPNSIVIVEDKEDPWFIHILTYRTKTGVIMDSSMIIASDLETWVNSVKRMGFELKK
jgi:3'-phosphoadenosine 5'-phosphosulfate (PAPS) 3'-phosphatase